MKLVVTVVAADEHIAAMALRKISADVSNGAVKGVGLSYAYEVDPEEQAETNGLFCTDEKLPIPGEDVLVWYPPGNCWVVGFLRLGTDQYGNFFHNYGFGAWYLQDGVTAWLPLPEAPSIRKGEK